MSADGFWHRGHWYELTPVLPDDERPPLPATVPHEEVAWHSFGCECDGCARTPRDLLGRLKRRARLRS